MGAHEFWVAAGYMGKCLLLGGSGARWVHSYAKRYVFLAVLCIESTLTDTSAYKALNQAFPPTRISDESQCGELGA